MKEKKNKVVVTNVLSIKSDVQTRFGFIYNFEFILIRKYIQLGSFILGFILIRKYIQLGSFINNFGLKLFNQILCIIRTGGLYSLWRPFILSINWANSIELKQWTTSAPMELYSFTLLLFIIIDLIFSNWVMFFSLIDKSWWLL